MRFYMQVAGAIKGSHFYKSVPLCSHTGRLFFGLYRFMITHTSFLGNVQGFERRLNFFLILFFLWIEMGV